MKKILLFLILVFTTTANYAQTDSTKSPRTGMIQYIPGGWFTSGKYVIDGNKVTFREVNTRLANYQPSANEFNEYRKYRNLTYYSGGTSILFLAASLIATGNSSTFKNTSSKVFAGIGVSFLVPEFIFSLKRNKHFRSAGTIYNQQFK